MNHPAHPFYFDLPRELIAQAPPQRRGDSRLMLVEPGVGAVGERPFRDIGDICAGAICWS